VIFVFGLLHNIFLPLFVLVNLPIFLEKTERKRERERERERMRERERE